MSFIKSIHKHTNAIPNEEMPERRFNYYSGISEEIAFLNKNNVYDIEEFLENVANGTKEVVTYLDLQLLETCFKVVDRAKRCEQTEVFGYKFNAFSTDIRNKNAKGDDVLL